MAPLVAQPSLSLFNEIGNYVTQKIADGRETSGDARLTFLQLQLQLPTLEKIHAKVEDLNPTDPAVRNRLGAGSFGTVYKVKWSFPRVLEGGTIADVHVDVAVKILKENNKLGVQDFIREAHLWVRVPPHPNVLPLVGICFRDNDHLRGLVSPFATGVMARWRTGERTYDERFKMVCDAAAGLKHLHQNGIVHGDLSVGNTFVVENTALLADFGQSILETYHAEEPHAHLLSQPARTSPARWTKKFDVNSFGGLMEQIMTPPSAGQFDAILDAHGLRELWKKFQNPRAEDHPADGAAIVEQIADLADAPAGADQ